MLDSDIYIACDYRSNIIDKMGSTTAKSPTAKEQDDERYFIFKEMIKRSAANDPKLHYQFEDRIGEGSYAEVYKVKSLSTGQYRVIKKVQRNNISNVGRTLFN